MDRIIYQTKGGMKKRQVIYLAAGIFLILAAVFCFWISGLEHKGIQATIGRTTGRLGGGPMFTEEGQTFLKAVGFFCVFSGLYSIERMIRGAMCWLKVFSDRIEFQPNGFLIKKETVSVMADQISSVSYSLQNGCVKVIGGGRSYQIACPKPEEAFRQIDAITRGK